MAIAVRKATTNDAAKIGDFALQMIEQHVDYDSIRFSRIGGPAGMANFYRGQTEAENASLLVAEQDGEIVGFAYMQFEPILYADLATRVAWLHDIFVDRSSRKSGAGTELIKAVVDEAKGCGANKILLSVAAKNKVAQGFFEYAGFQTTMHEMMLVVDDEKIG